LRGLRRRGGRGRRVVTLRVGLSRRWHRPHRSTPRRRLRRSTLARRSYLHRYRRRRPRAQATPRVAGSGLRRGREEPRASTQQRRPSRTRLPWSGGARPDRSSAHRRRADGAAGSTPRWRPRPPK
jgi:hypothetical protein